MFDDIIDLNLERLEAHVTETKAILKDGLLGIAIWSSATGLSLVSENTSDEAIALFNQLSGEIGSTLEGSGFPGLNRYYMVALKDGKSLLVMRHGDDLVEALILDGAKTNLGVLFSLAVPKAMKAIANARG